MKYTVWHCKPSGAEPFVVAECNWMIDADSVLTNSVSGYVTLDGLVVRTKGVNFGVGGFVGV